MKLVTFTIGQRKSVGAFENEKIIDLHAALVQHLTEVGEGRAKEIANAYIPQDMVEFIEGGQTSLKYAKKKRLNLHYKRKILHLSYLIGKTCAWKHRYRSPKKIICVGLNYREHILEMGRELPTNPVLFAKFANAIIGPEDNIPHHPISEQLDYEAEFTFVIGKRAKNVNQENALDYVAGYTICNDVTYRDIQRRTPQWLQGKSVDGAAPMGPWLVTADELQNPSGLNISSYVNGELRQQSNTENLVFSVQKLVEFISNLMTLEPGDVIMTGTPHGVGFAMEPQQFLKDGDIVRIEVETLEC